MTSGRYRVSFAEAPDAWHRSPETVEARAIAWARRNRDRLLASKDTALSFEAVTAGFFRSAGPWHERMTAKGQTMSARHLDNMQAILDNYLVPLFGELDPRQMGARQIDDSILALRKRNGTDMAPGTKYKIVHAMNAILADLAERDIITRNPLVGLQPYSKKPVRSRGALPRDVFADLFPPTHGALVRVWGKTMWAALMCVFGDTGMRPGEARRLTWQRVYEADSAIVIRHAEKAGNAGVGDTKTGAVRAGHLSARTLQELAIWRMESRFSGDEDLIFTLDGKEPVSDVAIGQCFKRGLKAVGVDTEKGGRGERWTPYWLRHTFVTYSLASLSGAEVALLAGHSEAISQGVYAHPDDAVVLSQSKSVRDKLKN